MQCSDFRRVCLSRLCGALRFSQPLDAFFRSTPCSLVSCCCHSWDSVCEGFPPHRAHLTSRPSAPVSSFLPRTEVLAAATSRVSAWCWSVPRIPVLPVARGRSFLDVPTLRGLPPIGPRLALSPCIFPRVDAQGRRCRSSCACRRFPPCPGVSTWLGRWTTPHSLSPRRRHDVTVVVGVRPPSHELRNFARPDGRSVSRPSRVRLGLRPGRLVPAPQRPCASSQSLVAPSLRPRPSNCACSQRTAGWLASFESCLPPWVFRPSADRRDDQFSDPTALNPLSFQQA